MREICKTCEFIYDARSAFIDGPGGPDMSIPARLEAESDNCFKRGESREEREERSTETMELNMTISFSEADRTLIRDLVSAVWELGGVRSVVVPVPEVEAITKSAPMPDFETPAQPEPGTKPETKPETEADSDQLLEAARDIIRAHAKTHRAEVKSLLEEYKARKASEVPVEALSEFLKRLKELMAV